MGIEQAFRRMLTAVQIGEQMELPFPHERFTRIEFGDFQGKKDVEWISDPLLPVYIEVAYAVETVPYLSGVTAQLIYNKTSCDPVELYEKTHILKELNLSPCGFVTCFFPAQGDSYPWEEFCKIFKHTGDSAYKISFEVATQNIILRENYLGPQRWLYTPPGQENIEVYWPLGGQRDGENVGQAYATPKQQGMKTYISILPETLKGHLKEVDHFVYQYGQRRFYFPLGFQNPSLESHIRKGHLTLLVKGGTYRSKEMGWEKGSKEKLRVVFEKD